MSGMRAAKHNVKAAEEILTVLAKNKCTVADACGIFSYIERKIHRDATVPEKDYAEELSSLYDSAADDE